VCEGIKKISAGFTMVEMMLVLLLLGIVAAVAVPAMNSSLDEMKLDAAAREVVSAIQYCQSQAIKTGSDTYKVAFNESTDEFMCKEDNSIVALHPLDKKPYKIQFNLEGHLQGVDIVSASFGSSNGLAVKFNSLGETDDAGAAVLGYAGFQKTINVTAPIGKITVN